MTNSSQIPLSTVEPEEGYDNMSEYIYHSDYTQDFIVASMMISVSALGILGNGIIIWLLGFYIKRSPVTTYILNLAVADFGVLMAACGAALLHIASDGHHQHLFLFFEELFDVTYTAGQFLLTVIGIDRCVLVFFPIWHRCHRPLCLPTIVCTIIWVFSLLVCEIPFIFSVYSEFSYTDEPCFFLIALLCLPLLSISTLVLFIKVYLKSQPYKPRKLLVAISLALLFFLIFAFPFTVLYILNYFYYSAYNGLYVWGFLCASLNSSINPVIYFLIGRKKQSPSRESLKVILQRVFKEENCGHPPVQMFALMSP